MKKKVAKKKVSKAKAPAKAAKNKKIRRAADARDITELMLEHHKPLKRLIKVMKKSDAEMSELRAAFEEFAPLLEAHAKPEESALYGYMKAESEEDDIRIEAFEGQTEHAIADALANQIKSLSDEHEWKACVKVLAELVEHHIEEEEEEMIPDLRKEIELEDRIAIGEEYLREREGFVAATEAA